MQIKWLGHACFLIAGEGARVVTDPFNEEVGYPLPAVEADVVTVSHEHFDHNYVRAVKGRPQVVREPGEHTAGAVRIKGIPTFHDGSEGALRGNNTVFVIEMDGLRVCHLGDLGHMLDAGQLKELGPVDVLLVPVGGMFTVDANAAARLVADIKPAVAVPMHYATAAIKLPLAPVQDFTGRFERVTEKDVLEVTKDNLHAPTQIVVLKLAGTD